MSKAYELLGQVRDEKSFLDFVKSLVEKPVACAEEGGVGERQSGG